LEFGTLLKLTNLSVFLAMKIIQLAHYSS